MGFHFTSLLSASCCGKSKPFKCLLNYSVPITNKQIIYIFYRFYPSLFFNGKGKELIILKGTYKSFTSIECVHCTTVSI